MTARAGTVLFLAAFVAAACVAGCSGSSSSSVTPAPTPSQTGAFVPVANAGRGSLTLGLGALKTAQYYAWYLRPGARSTLAWYRLVATRKRPSALLRAPRPLDPSGVPTPNPAPSCDPASQTALSSQADVTGKNYVVVTAFYPGGDSKCSKSPYAVSEMYYPDVPRPFSQGPQLGVGYQVSFVNRAVAEFDIVNTSIYAAAEGRANVDTRLDRYDASQAPAFTPPGPGVFPATFPLAFPLPSPPPEPPGSTFVSDFYATLETGTGTSTTGTATLVTTNPLFLPYSSLGPAQNLAAIDSLAVTVRANGGGFSYSAVHKDPLYAFDVVPIALADGGTFLGAGNTTWALEPLTSGVSASNFGDVASDAATYGANGSVTAQAATFHDLVNAVTAAVTREASGGSISITDDLRHAAATSPAAPSLGLDGTSARFTYVLDGSYGLVLVNSVVE